MSISYRIACRDFVKTFEFPGYPNSLPARRKYCKKCGNRIYMLLSGDCSFLTHKLLKKEKYSVYMS